MTGDARFGLGFWDCVRSTTGRHDWPPADAIPRCGAHPQHGTRGAKTAPSRARSGSQPAKEKRCPRKS